MRLSLNWISRLLRVDNLGVPTADLLARLTLRVAEFESEFTSTGPQLDGVVVGKVLTCIQHPNADKLRMTTVDIGDGRIEPIVCGAANIAAGQTVAVATIGTTLSMPGKDGKLSSITIKEAKLRGEISRGMICAEDELGIGSSHDGIMVLDSSLAAGTPLAHIMGRGDTVLSIENSCLTHRPDLWGHWGWAVEIAAVCGLPPPTPLDTHWKTHADSAENWSAEIASDGCLRYSGAIVEGVANSPSPQWMQELLKSVGLRPLGFLVDVTNLVMLETGEPMHAFDRRGISGSRIIVRNATANEGFKTIDGRNHQLSSDDILITDGQKPLALAGIMGGEQSMVAHDTTSVLLEAATFHGGSIRRTRIRTGVATDSSARFEKGLYVECTAAALNRAIAIIQETFPKAHVTHRFNAGSNGSTGRSITLPTDAVRRTTGLDLPIATQLQILTSLGFSGTHEHLSVPWWRTKDVTCCAEIVEEIARHHGYEHITPETPRLPAAAPVINTLRSSEHRTRRILSAHGWDEVATYAFTSQAWVSAIQREEGAINLHHPLSSDQAVLRPSLLPNLLEAITLNRKHREHVALYEIGKRYGYGIGSKDTPDEELVVAGVVAAHDDEAPFYAARDAALELLRGLGYTPLVEVRTTDHPELLTSRSIDIRVNKVSVGYVGEVPKALRSVAQCPERVAWFCLYLEQIVRTLGIPTPIMHQSPSRFPAVNREFTWVCPESKPYADLAHATRHSAGTLCTNVELITIYRGDPIPTGEKAVSLRLTVQSHDKTLEEKDLQALCTRVVQFVEKNCSAKLRMS